MASCRLASSTDMTMLVLRHSEFFFGERQNIHVWLTWNDQENANMMILLSYILLGHPEWQEAEIRVFVAIPTEQLAERQAEFQQLMAEGRLPISEKNVRFYPTNDLASFQRLVVSRSSEADLTVVGFDMEGLEERGRDVFLNHPALKDVLFVHTPRKIQMA